jgi:hypothetical protein
MPKDPAVQQFHAKLVLQQLLWRLAGVLQGGCQDERDEAIEQF